MQSIADYIQHNSSHSFLDYLDGCDSHCDQTVSQLQKILDNSDEEDEDKHNHGTDGPGEIFKESDENRGANDRTRQSNDEGYNCEEIIKNQQEKIVVFIVTVMLIKISDKSFESCSS